jgi:DUF971 family protein
MSDELRPLTLRREGEGLKITWSDGVATFSTWRHLRTNCPCAACIEVRVKPPDPFRVLTAEEVAAGSPQPAAMRPVGLYAYQINWNDGHSTGIYTLEYLRKLGTVQSDQDRKQEGAP